MMEIKEACSQLLQVIDDLVTPEDNKGQLYGFNFEYLFILLIDY